MNVTRWERIELEQLSEKITRQMLNGADGTIARIVLRKGAVVPRHSHRSEQYSLIVSGVLRFTFDDREVDVREGEIVFIGANEPHSAVALEDTVDIDFFSPRREDWVTKNDAYLRGNEEAD